MLNNTQVQQIADSISEQQLNIIKLHIEYGLKSKDNIHPRALFADTKALLECDDFPQFNQLLTSCMRVGKLSGYTTGKGGVILRAEQIQNYLSIQPEKPKEKDKREIVIDKCRYSYLVRDADIKLLLNVLGAKEDENGAVEFIGKKYSCSEIDLLKKFLISFFGGRK